MSTPDQLKETLEGLAKSITDLTTTVTTLVEKTDRNSTAIQRLEVKSTGMADPGGSRHGGSGGGRFYDRPPKPGKLDFPKYSGKDDPLPFLNRCEAYFQLGRIMEEEKVLMAALHLEDMAQLWYMRVSQEEGTPSWRRFAELLNLRFGPPLRSHPLGELTTCRRTGTVAEYQDRFLGLLPRAGSLTDHQQVQLFTVGLGEPLSLDVQMQNPQTLEMAMSLARSYERRELAVQAQAAKPQRRGLLPTPPLPLPSTKPPGVPPATAASSSASTPSVTVAGRTIKRLTPEEMETRRREGLCFNCNEKYVRGHNKVCAHLFLLELEDEEDDEEGAAKEEPLISLHAIAGVRTSETMQVTMALGGTTLRALLDSGSTHNFVSEEAAVRTDLRYQHRRALQVTVANGERVPCAGVFRNATFTIGGEVFSSDFFVLPLAGYDVVLGTQWLATLGPILWDFGQLTMSFWRTDHRVEWRGVAGAASPHLHSSEGRNLLDELLTAFDDVFSEPRGLPPQRARDHRIHLLPGTEPVPVRPYRYPAAHKDELERQCRDMAAQGLIRRSSSAFSSPVLLVRKADGSWRFCVDYRALNARTVKDTFPIPVVDELLDELHGAKYFTKLDLRSGYHQVRMHPDDIYNTAYQVSLKDTPFQVVYGREPPCLRSYEPGESRVAAVARSLSERDELLADVRYRLEQAQGIAKRNYDKKHRQVEFKKDEWVWLRVRHRTPLSLPSASVGKLKPRYYGPYKIAEMINPVAARLVLPAGARIHDVFHIGLLKKFVGDPPDAPPPLPLIHYGAALPVPERAVRMRIARGVRQVLVRWLGEPASAATWEDVDSFVQRYPAFQLEDELLVEGGRDVMWGIQQYSRRKKKSVAPAS
ncbi:unnamed protein product [Urochloa humidicola]